MTPLVPIIKICGLSHPAALDAALALGVERVGFVFFPKSPRNLGLEAAHELAGRVRGRAAIVALTVDADDASLAAIVEAADPDLLQLHGRETPARVIHVRARFGRPVMKALGVSAVADLARLPAYAAVADEILFDAKPPAGAARPGGNGLAFDWGILAALDPSLRFMLSGGLTPGNVAEAVRVTRAPGVDVSSGVESGPGVKDPDKIAAFVRSARGLGPTAISAPQPGGSREARKAEFLP